jgi:hypothetical protein
MLAALERDRRALVDRFNADFQKPFFARKADGC